MIDGIKVLDNPNAWSYKVVSNSTTQKQYNILLGKIELLEDPLQPGEYPLYAKCTGVEPLPYKNNLDQHFNIETQQWEYLENHIGENGYIDGKQFTINDYGPYPDGFTKELPLAKQKEIYEIAFKQKILSILNSTDFLMMPDYPLGQEDKNKLIEFRHILRNLDKQDGYPWFNDDSFIFPKWPLEGVKSKPYVEFE